MYYKTLIISIVKLILFILDLDLVGLVFTAPHNHINFAVCKISYQLKELRKTLFER